MYISERKDRNGVTYFSFSYVDQDGKRVRLKKSEHPIFTTREEAEEWAKSQDATSASKKAYIARKLSWRIQYHDFEKLIEKYSSWQKQRAPNSWQSSVYYLEQWVFAFFLVEKRVGNVNDWHLYLQEFLDWLQRDDVATKKGRKTKLAASTVNNIIKALNTFLTCLSTYNDIDPDSVKKAPVLGDHLLNHRSFQDVISNSEMEVVYAAMCQINVPAAEFFLVLWHTGMRFSELFGLQMTKLFRGKIANKSLQGELEKYNIDYHGYIYLDSQPFHDDRRREDDGSIKRKPLKSHKTIGPRNARVIPIRSKEVWNILANRFKVQTAEFLRKRYTADKNDYMLFDDLEWNKAVNTLKKGYERLGRTPKQYHCCRHSFTTLLVGETRSYFLVRAITGHRKDKSFEKYLHIYEQIAQEAQQNVQEIDVIS